MGNMGNFPGLSLRSREEVVAVALPKNNRTITMAESVEISLEGLDDDLAPADMAIVTAVRMAAKAIDALIEKDPDNGPIKALQYHYMVTGGLEKLGGSVKARKELGTTAKKPPSGLAAVRGIRDKSSNSKGAAADRAGVRKPPASRKKAS